MKNLISGLLLTLLLGGCESEYTKLVKTELSSGVSQDSIVFNIRFGDSKEYFYNTCWKLNKQGLITNGPKNSMVKYTFYDSNFHIKSTKIEFLFYGDFDESGAIRGMDCEFTYPGWSPWNTNLWSDSLEVKALRIVKEWYGGNDFIKITQEDKKDFWVKVDGNRRIVIRKLDEKYVQMKIHNLLHEDYKHSNL